MRKPKNNLPRRISGTALSVMLTVSLILNGGYGRVSGADTTENQSDNTPSVSEKRQTAVSAAGASSTSVQTAEKSIGRQEKKTKLSSGEVVETSIYDFEYKLSENDEVIITKYIGTDTEVVIPEDFNGYYVIEIADSAFYYNETIEKVTLSPTVEKIGNYAFYQCRNLKNIYFGESLKEIGTYAFGRCYALTEVKLPDTCKTIGNDAFYYCSAMKTLDLGNSMETLGNCAFQRCYALENVVLPDSLTSMGTYCFDGDSAVKTITIGTGLKTIPYEAFYGVGITAIEFPDNIEVIDDYAFSNCSSLKDIVWSANIKSIGKYAFNSNYALTTFTIPDTVKSIGEGALHNCTALESIHLGKLVSDFGASTVTGDTALTSITVHKDNEYFSNDSKGVLFNKDKTILIKMGNGCEESYTIPSTVQKIGKYAFSYCKKLTSVTIGENVDTVDEYAFEYCTLFTEINFTNKLTTINHNAFQYCSALEKVTFGNALQTVGSGAFYSCRKLNNIVLPDTCTKLDSSAFSYCTALSELDLGKGMVTIGSSCFYNCTALKAVSFPSTLKTIDNSAFQSTALETVVIPDGVETLGSWAFCYCSMKTLTIGNGVKSLPSYVFLGCTSLEEVTFPDSLQRIGYEAFYNCTSLKAVNLKEGVTYIDSYAFYNDEALTELVLPESMVTVSNYAFQECSSLKTVYIGKNVTSLPATAFYGDIALEGITVSEDNITFASTDGVLFDKHVTEILIFPRAKSGKYVLPDTVLKVNGNAFNNASKLTAITIGESVQSIGESAFIGCSSLETVVINENCESVGRSAFENCTSLKTVALGKYTKSMGDYVFENCTALESVSLGERLTYISYCAFQGCTSLTSISLPDTVTGVSSYAFLNCKALKDVDLGEGVESLGYEAFYNTKITDITLPDSLKSIDRYVFSNTPLQSIHIGKGLSSIETYYNFPETLSTITVSEENLNFSATDNVLYNRDMSTLVFCPRTREGIFTIPDTVTTLGDYAFAYCKSLTGIKEYGNVIAANTNAIYSLTKNNFTAYVIEESFLNKLFADNGYTCEIIEDTRTKIGDCDLRYEKYVLYGYSVKADLKIYDGDKQLIENKDFKAYYSNDRRWVTGEATITVYGMGEYGGNTTVQFYIYREFTNEFTVRRTGAATYTLKNAANDGVPEYESHFAFAKTEDVQAGNAVWTEIPNPDNLSSISYFFEEDGEFTVRSIISDKIDNTITKYEEISVTAPRARMSFSDDTVTFGKTITITAYGNNFGRNKQYKFECDYGDADEWYTISDFSTTVRDIDFTFDKIGTYKIRLTIVDDAGNTAEKTQSFDIEKPQVDFVLSKQPALNESISIKTSINAVADDYTYKYEYRKSGETTWTTIKSFTAAKTCPFAFTETGTFQIRITSRYKKDTTVKSTRIKSVVIDAPVVKLSVPESADMGTNATLTATATAFGEAVTYKYQYKSVTDTSWRNLYNGAETTVQLPLQQTGVYTARVIATDGFGNKSISTGKIAVAGAQVELIADNPKVYVGDEINLSTKFKSYTGGTADYTYKFEYRECLSSTWHTLQDYSGDSSASFTARQCATSDQYASYAGMYEMKVTAKDKNGVTSTSTTTVLVKKMELSFALSEYTVAPETEVTLSANVVGGAKPVKFMYEFAKDNGIWQPLVYSNYTEKDVVRFTFSAEGTYRIRVSAKDKNGLTIGNTADEGGVGYEGQILTLTVRKPVVQTLKATLSAKESSILTGKNTLLTAYSQYATGNVSYQFTVSSSFDSSEKLLQDFDSNDKIVFNGEKEGIYYVTVTAKDEAGNTSVAKTTIYVREYSLYISSNYNEVTSGRDFHVNANVSYGDQDIYEFKYEYRPKGSSTWKVASDFTEERVQRFTLYTTGTYDIKVTARNSSGIEKTATISVTVNEKLNSMIAATPQNITVNSETVLICCSTGGTGNITYQYEYCLTGTGVWNTFSKDNSSSVTTFSADTAGVYKVRAKATDSTGASKRTEYINIRVK